MIAEALPADPDEPALSKDEYREYLKTTRLEASGMSRIAPPAEKIAAVGKITRELIAELGEDLDLTIPGVQATLLDVAARIAMATDTRDMGILGAPAVPFEGKPRLSVEEVVDPTSMEPYA